MRFVSNIDVFLPGDIVTRAPGVWDRLKAMWAPVDLGTDRMRDRIEGATFVYELRAALDELGIDNARSLVVDGVTVFHDARRVTGDLPDLLLALSDHVSLFGDRSQELRLSVEHEEAGLQLVIDAAITSEHRGDAPSARIDVVGHASEVNPRRGESAADYRARIEPLVRDAKLGKTLRLQFGAFVSRLEEALGRVFTETRFEVKTEVQDAASLPFVQPLAEAPPAPRAARIEATAAPIRNFTLTTEERIGALLTGPPPYAVRLRSIESLEDELVAALAACEAAGASSIPIGVARKIEQANNLIREHNRWYPVERNLPMDATTGALLDMGEPWKERAILTIDGLRARARRRFDARG
jgi:hypothetical protein